MKPAGRSWRAILALVVSGCVSTDVTPLAQNTVLVSTKAALACGRNGARRAALELAAAETIRRGYDRFIIVGAEGGSEVYQVGTTPVFGTTNVQGQLLGSRYSGTATTTVYGGQPIFGGAHNQELAVRMFRVDDPGAENALDARAELGPAWADKVAKKQHTCF